MELVESLSLAVLQVVWRNTCQEWIRSKRGLFSQWFQDQCLELLLPFQNHSKSWLSFLPFRNGHIMLSLCLALFLKISASNYAPNPVSNVFTHEKLRLFRIRDGHKLPVQWFVLVWMMAGQVRHGSTPYSRMVSTHSGSAWRRKLGARWKEQLFSYLYSRFNVADS